MDRRLSSAGLPSFRELRKEGEKHPVEEVGRKLRAFMPWLASDRLVDQVEELDRMWRARLTAGAPAPGAVLGASRA